MWPAGYRITFQSGFRRRVACLSFVVVAQRSARFAVPCGPFVAFWRPGYDCFPATTPRIVLVPRIDHCPTIRGASLVPSLPRCGLLPRGPQGCPFEQRSVPPLARHASHDMGGGRRGGAWLRSRKAAFQERRQSTFNAASLEWWFAVCPAHGSLSDPCQVPGLRGVPARTCFYHCPGVDAGTPLQPGRFCLPQKKCCNGVVSV